MSDLRSHFEINLIPIISLLFIENFFYVAWETQDCAFFICIEGIPQINVLLWFLIMKTRIRRPNSASDNVPKWVARSNGPRLLCVRYRVATLTHVYPRGFICPNASVTAHLHVAEKWEWHYGGRKQTYYIDARFTYGLSWTGV